MQSIEATTSHRVAYWCQRGSKGASLSSLRLANGLVLQFVNVTQSKGGALALTFIVWLLIMFGTINSVTTASRQLWSFARDRGVPWSVFLSRVQPGQHPYLNFNELEALLT